MICEHCEHFDKYYTYSKKYGFVYLHQGRCTKDNSPSGNQCYCFDEVAEASKQDNFYVETNLVEMLVKCEEIIKQLKVLIKLYNPNKKINPPPQKERPNSMIVFD